MSDQERRIAPRKECSVPLRFRVIETRRPSGAPSQGTPPSMPDAATQSNFGMLEGQAQNLSERGLYFVCSEKVDVGQEVEMFFTIPAELTGRGPEDVQCRARIVHAEPLERDRDLTGAGVVVRSMLMVARTDG